MDINLVNIIARYGETFYVASLRIWHLNMRVGNAQISFKNQRKSEKCNLAEWIDEFCYCRTYLICFTLGNHHHQRVAKLQQQQPNHVAAKPKRTGFSLPLTSSNHSSVLPISSSIQSTVPSSSKFTGSCFSVYLNCSLFLYFKEKIQLFFVFSFFQ